MPSIREGTTQDIDRIIEIAHQVWPVTYRGILSDQQLRYMLDLLYARQALQHQMLLLGHHFLIGAVDGVESGFASYSAHADDQKIYHLNKLYVLPEFQRTGLGAALIKEVVNRIQSENAEALQLNVNRSNKAIGFYQKNGFQVIRQEDIDIGNGFFMNDFVMELRLGNIIDT